MTGRRNLRFVDIPETRRTVTVIKAYNIPVEKYQIKRKHLHTCCFNQEVNSTLQLL